jgi:hypothetical protein
MSGPCACGSERINAYRCKCPFCGAVFVAPEAKIINQLLEEVPHSLGPLADIARRFLQSESSSIPRLVLEQAWRAGFRAGQLDPEDK